MPSAGGMGVTLSDLIGEIGKDAVRDGDGIYCTQRVAARTWRLHISAGLRARDCIGLVIGTDALAARRLAAARELLTAASHRPRPQAKARNLSSRSALIHCSILQAIDGVTAGASQRDIAIAIYGRTEVLERWSSDGELRARIRYFVRRGGALVQSEYQKLVYL